jgi:hypothetical protein
VSYTSAFVPDLDWSDTVREVLLRTDGPIVINSQQRAFHPTPTNRQREIKQKLTICGQFSCVRWSTTLPSQFPIDQGSHTRPDWDLTLRNVIDGTAQLLRREFIVASLVSNRQRRFESAMIDGKSTSTHDNVSSWISGEHSRVGGPMRLTMLMVPLLLCQALPATRAVTTPAAHADSQAFATTSRGQLVANPELMAGAWEIGRPDGVDGIFVSIRTHVQDVAGQSMTSTQDVHIRVYHRDASNETGGWYTAGTSEPAVFDGNHLRLRAVSDGPVIDVTFDSGKRRWVGTWARGGNLQDVILERPHAADSSSMNDLLGDWEGMSDPAHLYHASTRLHIYKSRDGAMTAWMDRIIAPIDQRHGELLNVAASENPGIILTTRASAGMTYRFRGALSVDGSTLNGMWQSETGTGGTLNAETSFRRIR